MPGDTLASNDSVAMTPMVQPAAAGTPRYRDFGRLVERLTRVIGREDIRCNLGMGGGPTRPALCIFRPDRGRAPRVRRWLPETPTANSSSRRGPGRRADPGIPRTLSPGPRAR